MRNKSLLILFMIILFAKTPAVSKDLFFEFKADRPLFLFLQAGLPGNDEKPIEIEENTEFNASWNISGALIFASNDKITKKRYNGISAAYLNSIGVPDWSKIQYKVQLKWKNKTGKKIKKNIIEGSFTDSSVRKSENDAFNSDDSTYVRDYKFSIMLKDTSYKFLMPIHPETYKMNVEVTYPVSVWKNFNGKWKLVPRGRMSSRTQDREIKVLDVTPPEIILEKGLEKGIDNCTTGDPLPDDGANVLILVKDNNPNADIKQISVESNNQLYMFPVTNKVVSFDENEEFRFIGEYKFKIPNQKGQILKAPTTEEPLKYQIIASDSSSNAGMLQSQIPNKDNDPPNVKFIFNDVSGIIYKAAFDPLNSKGKIEIDITDLNSRKVLYVDEYPSPDPKPVILKTNNFTVKQNTRVMFQAFPYDNVDKKPVVKLNGQKIPKEGKRFIFTDSSRQETVLELKDSKDNKRKIIIPIHVRKMYFNSNTLGVDK